MKSNPPAPKISAIITTYNRPQLFVKALLSLATQTLDSSEYEVIVVDDGSSEETRQVAERLACVFPFKYVYQHHSGLASAKNHGLFHAKAPIVLFLDDDDLSDSNLLEQHLRAHVKYHDPNIAILGFTRLAANLESDPLMGFVTGKGGHLFTFSSIPENQHLQFDRFWGGRTSCKRKYLLSHGVFNPVFKFGFEDIELGYRLSRHGLHVVFWKQAVNTMIRLIDIDAFLRRCYLQGKSGSKFLSLYPEDKSLAKSIAFSGFNAEWELIENNLDDVVSAARRLDAMVRCLPTTKPGSLVDMNYYINLLHYAYFRAFRAKTIHGYIDAQSEVAAEGGLFPVIR
ncbi:glycosyltransferase family 2 protein [Synechococcus sp. 1G10]|uniref:glycosyltransferase family 2 protein n=1 Tax=Synechococcus sp. 1G10 TaxID=2025605 RepID=UPI000B98CFFD|nr:glycosyltransferase family 2 protein [Synechococcus sp. 1G10]